MHPFTQQAIREIHATMDSDELYFLVTRHLQELFGIEKFSIFLCDNDNRQYNLDFSTLIDSGYWDEIFFTEDDVPFAYFAGQEPLHIPSQLTWFGNEFDLYWVSLATHGDETAFALVVHEFIEDFATIADAVTEYLDNLCLALIKAKLYEEMRNSKEESAAKLDAINEMGELLGNLELERILAKLMELSLKILAAEVGSIMLYNDEGELETSIEWGLKDAFVKAITVDGDTLLVEKVAASREVCYIEDLPHDERITITDRRYAVNSLISFPLFTKEKAYGVINIINRENGSVFGSREIETLKTVAQLASIAIENAIYHRQAVEQEKILEQLRIAGEIQRGLLPQQDPVIAGLDISGISIPAVNVGGDFFDYIHTREEKLCVVIGDVAGKGVPAALLMAMSRSMLRTQIQEMGDSAAGLEKKVAAVNRLLTHENLNGKFVTALLYILDLLEMKVYVLSAGHNPMYIYRRRLNLLQTCNEGGIPFGILEDEDYHHAVVTVEPGDILVTYTDGITEAQNRKGEFFGSDRLERLIMELADQEAKIIRNVIIKEVENFARGVPQFDDLTLVVARIGEK